MLWCMLKACCRINHLMVKNNSIKHDLVNENESIWGMIYVINKYLELLIVCESFRDQLWSLWTNDNFLMYNWLYWETFVCKCFCDLYIDTALVEKIYIWPKNIYNRSYTWRVKFGFRENDRPLIHLCSCVLKGPNNKIMQSK